MADWNRCMQALLTLTGVSTFPGNQNAESDTDMYISTGRYIVGGPGSSMKNGGTGTTEITPDTQISFIYKIIQRR